MGCLVIRSKFASQFMPTNLQVSPPFRSPVSPILLASLHHTSPNSAKPPSQGGICSPTGHPSRRKFNLRTETRNLVLPPPLLEHSFSGQLELQQTHCSTSMTKWSPVSPPSTCSTTPHLTSPTSAKSPYQGSICSPTDHPIPSCVDFFAVGCFRTKEPSSITGEY